MDRVRLHEGICQMRFLGVLGRAERSELSQVEAAELLGVGERTFRRWRDRHRPGLVMPAKTRSAHRKKRPRRPMVGMILHQDASTHAWLAADAGKQDRGDDGGCHQRAVFGFPVGSGRHRDEPARGAGAVARHGLFCPLYSHYFETPELDAYGVEADISQPTISAETVDNEQTRTPAIIDVLANGCDRECSDPPLDLACSKSIGQGFGRPFCCVFQARRNSSLNFVP
jgi:hypothetical protein